MTFRGDCRSSAGRQADALSGLAAARWAEATRPVPYADHPDYVEGRLDYFEGVCYQTYADSSPGLWRLGFLEAKADYPTAHGISADG